MPALADAPLLDFFDPAVEADPEPFSSSVISTEGADHRRLRRRFRPR